jgi:hypothetical protein
VLIALAVLALMAVTAASFWVFQRSRAGQVDHVVIAYQVLNDSSVTVTFEVHKPAAIAVLCLVEALGDDGGPVGSKEVRLGPNADARVTTTLTTTARAYTGVVQACREERP